MADPRKPQPKQESDPEPDIQVVSHTPQEWNHLRTESSRGQLLRDLIENGMGPTIAREQVEKDFAKRGYTRTAKPPPPPSLEPSLASLPARPKPSSQKPWETHPSPSATTSPSPSSQMERNKSPQLPRAGVPSSAPTTNPPPSSRMGRDKSPQRPRSKSPALSSPTSMTVRVEPRPKTKRSSSHRDKKEIRSSSSSNCTTAPPPNTRPTAPYASSASMAEGSESRSEKKHRSFYPKSKATSSTSSKRTNASPPQTRSSPSARNRRPRSPPSPVRVRSPSPQSSHRSHRPSSSRSRSPSISVWIPPSSRRNNNHHPPPSSSRGRSRSRSRSVQSSYRHHSRSTIRGRSPSIAAKPEKADPDMDEQWRKDVERERQREEQENIDRGINPALVKSMADEKYKFVNGPPPPTNYLTNEERKTIDRLETYHAERGYIFPPPGTEYCDRAYVLKAWIEKNPEAAHSRDPITSHSSPGTGGGSRDRRGHYQSSPGAINSDTSSSEETLLLLGLASLGQRLQTTEAACHSRIGYSIPPPGTSLVVRFSLLDDWQARRDISYERTPRIAELAARYTSMSPASTGFSAMGAGGALLGGGRPHTPRPDPDQDALVDKLEELRKLLWS